MEPPRAEDSPPPSMAVAMQDRQTVRPDLAARPDMADRGEYLILLSASSVFLLGMLAFLGYIYLDPVRERLYQAVLNKERKPLRRGSHTKLRS